MKKLILSKLASVITISAILSSTATFANDLDDQLMVVTASNTINNQLMVYNSTGTLLKSIPTGGQGGVGGNAGGIAYGYDRLAVVNFGSGTVSVFRQEPELMNFRLEQEVRAFPNPVSVAFGKDHLYILSATRVESHLIDETWVSGSPDGVASLVKADGSAAQVGVVDGQLVITEKSNAIETVNLDGHGAITGTANLVANIPVNVNAPFGLVTRGNNAYVTIAHADEIGLVRNSNVLTVTSSGTQHAPCWLALDGPFLFSSNSPSMSVSRYAVYGQNIVQDAAVAASFTGSPTDIAYKAGLLAVIDGDSNKAISHVSVFKVDEDGNLTITGVATINNAATNGIAIVRQQKEIAH